MANQERVTHSVGYWQPVRKVLAGDSPPGLPAFPLTSRLGASGSRVKCFRHGAVFLVLSCSLYYRPQACAGVWWDMANLGCEALRSQDGESFLYFAYGGNLLTERIHLRNPSAVFYSVALAGQCSPSWPPRCHSALSEDKADRILRTHFLGAAHRQHWSRMQLSLLQSSSAFPARPSPHPLPPQVPLVLSQPSA